MGVFDRIVCGVDGSSESLEAARQADVLLEPGGRLVLVAVADLTRAIHIQVAPTAIHALRRALDEADELDRAAQDALERARSEVRSEAEVATLQTGGLPASCLLDSVGAEQATVVVVGTHGLGQAAGILLGSVATRVLHRAPCSVFVARRPRAGDRFPSAIVVGDDGSMAAAAALRAGRELESRFGAELRVVTEAADLRPAHALVEAAGEADLLAVGAHGDTRVHAFGSVAEHVAHEAHCSVLVVRETEAAPGVTT
jgi:nucleotide-binding universal stress UspA family protein